MYELKIIRERKQGYGSVRRVRDAADIYAAFRDEFSQFDREIFVAVLLDGKNPSAEDRALTERLEQMGELLGIRVLDHVVVGDGSFVSMAEREGWS